MLCLLVFAVAASAQTNVTAKAGNAPAVNAPVETDRSRDGLTGPVRRVRTEVAKLSTADGRLAEGKHALVELVAYDLKGNKIENQYFPMAGATLTGKEVYKYDEKGNISEMTLLNPDGTLLSKEVYKYEFDFAGNWNKMTTSVAVPTPETHVLPDTPRPARKATTSSPSAGSREQLEKTIVPSGFSKVIAWRSSRS